MKMNPPKGWRRIPCRGDTAADAWLTNDGVRYENAYVSFSGARLTRHVVPELELENLEIFPVPPEHPAHPGMGVRALCDIEEGTPVAYYTGVCRPGHFAPDNPYVFQVQGAPAELDLVIDGLTMGNATRYINDPRGMPSGALPNLEAEDGSYSSGPQTVYAVLLRATRYITKGDELLFDYEQHEKGSYWEEHEEEPESKKSKAKEDTTTTEQETDLPSFYEQFSMLAARLERFDPIHRKAINPGTCEMLLYAARQAVIQCAMESGQVEQLTSVVQHRYEIPSGHRQCTGPCKQVLALDHEHFHYNGKKDTKGKPIFRSQCKRCISKDNMTKRRRDLE
jgi:hypothetical protein